MKLVPINLLNSFDSMIEEFDKNFTDSFAGHFYDEDAANLYFTMDMPGVSKENLKIEIENNLVTAIGESKGKKSRKYTKTFVLPNTVDMGRVEAALKDGVLTITAPKTENKVKRVIEVK